MAGLVDLSALSKSSVKVAAFGVKLVGGRASTYSYTSKRDGSIVGVSKQSLRPTVLATSRAQRRL